MKFARATLLRAVYASVAIAVWLLTCGGALRKRGVVVLCYHGVRDSQRQRFERQMQTLRGRTIASQELDQTRQGRGKPRILLTFDDAFANLMTNALPALERNNHAAAIFAVTDNLGAPPRWSMPADHPERSERTMTEAELRNVAQTPGVIIGSHTHTHPRLDEVSREQLTRELTTSRSELESLSDAPIRELALPHGAWSPAVIDAARAAGYEKIYTLEHDLEPSRLGAGVIGRFSMSPDVSPLEFRLMIDGAYAWLGALRRFVRGRRRVTVSAPGVLKATA